MNNMLKAAKKARAIADLLEFKHGMYEAALERLEEERAENKRLSMALECIAMCDACAACREIAKVAVGEV